jgi:hypothetical protein
MGTKESHKKECEISPATEKQEVYLGLSNKIRSAVDNLNELIKDASNNGLVVGINITSPNITLVKCDTKIDVIIQEIIEY